MVLHLCKKHFDADPICPVYIVEEKECDYCNGRRQT